MAHMQERLNKQAQQYIAAGERTARQLWIKACEHDGIAPDSSFVVFSDGNKFAKFYNQCRIQISEARQQYRDGGYVGLSISTRKLRA